MNIAIALAAAYLLGSIPSAVWFCRLIGGIDIREHGSKNAGLTNTIRVLGWKAALPVTVVDLGKGIASPLLARALCPDMSWAPLLAGVLTIVGHSFTCFAGFRGGKGVLASLGVFLVLAPDAAGFAFAVFLAIVLATRYVSLGSIVATWTLAASLGAKAALGGFDPAAVALAAMGALIAVFVTVKHRTNIRRLRAGTESRFGEKAKAPETKGESK